jgi:hypothetical protein
MAKLPINMALHALAPNFLHAVVEERKLWEDYEIQLLTNSDEDGWTLPIAVMANDDGYLEVKLFVEEEANHPENGGSPFREFRANRNTSTWLRCELRQNICVFKKTIALRLIYRRRYNVRPSFFFANLSLIL